MTHAPFSLNPKLDGNALAAQFAAIGRVRISGFLAEDSTAVLRDHLDRRTDWLQLIGGDEKLFEIDRATRAAFTQERREALDEAVYSAARSGFQFRFESVRVSDDTEARKTMQDPLGAFARWMAGAEALDFLRTVTGDMGIGFVDAQATCYGAGDFLTAHDDAVPGKGRRAAYVLGLTPTWRMEWGGLLLYHGRDGEMTGYMPGFNTLDLFRVPQIHSVSLVSPSAGAPRLSVTGWLRDPAGLSGQ